MTDTVDCLYLSISALALLLLMRFFRDYRLDKVRDDMFTLRDQLFDYAAENELLQHPGYRQLREIMNAMIRFAHKISVSRLLLSMFLDRFVPETERRRPFDEWHKTLDNLPQYHQGKLINFHIELGYIITRFVVRDSIFARIIVSLARVYLLVKDFYLTVEDTVVKKLMMRTARGWQLIEAQALEARR
jgi:hypothetical protein